MKLSGNTILITGGSSGIGLELSKQLIERNNRVIICGRSEQRLNDAKAQIPELEIFKCNLSNKNQCYDLALWIKKEHPRLNLLINNAAIVNKTSFLETDRIIEMAKQEMETNFMAPVRLIHFLYPQLQKNENSAIINITTGLIYAPRADYPFYNATKAALHSFTQVFRKQTEESKTAIIEVMFPAVKTTWHKGNPPKIAISTDKAVDEMLLGLEKGKLEIRVAGAKLLYRVSRIAPKFAFKKVNSLKDA
ncbi:MAG: SDR family NAD(P)-dependent oxidoreductase [Cellulophaga sp.]